MLQVTKVVVDGKTVLKFTPVEGKVENTVPTELVERAIKATQDIEPLTEDFVSRREDWRHTDG